MPCRRGPYGVFAHGQSFFGSFMVILTPCFPCHIYNKNNNLIYNIYTWYRKSKMCYDLEQRNTQNNRNEIKGDRRNKT